MDIFAATTIYADVNEKLVDGTDGYALRLGKLVLVKLRPLTDYNSFKRTYRFCCFVLRV